MTECFKCGGIEIAMGKLNTSSEEIFSDIVFKPGKLRFLALTLQHGTKLYGESYACLKCGSVWSQTDPDALRDFILKNCKRPKNEESKG